MSNLGSVNMNAASFRRKRRPGLGRISGPPIGWGRNRAERRLVARRHLGICNRKPTKLRSTDREMHRRREQGRWRPSPERRAWIENLLGETLPPASHVGAKGNDNANPAQGQIKIWLSTQSAAAA